MNPFLVDENQVEQIDGMTTEYPYCLHKRDLTDFIVPWHWHEELELGYLQEGDGKIIMLDAEYIVRQGERFFINSNVMDMKKSAVPGQRVLEINHIFHPVFLSGHFKSRFDKKYLAPVINNHQIEVYIIRRGKTISDQILDNLCRLMKLQSQDNVEFQTRNMLSETWLLLLEELRTNREAHPSVKFEQQDRIRSMLSFIHNHYKDKITVAQIADAAGISEREAMRSFRNGLHQSPIEYLISYRLNEAKKLLRNSDLSITELCYQCGFSESSYFGKVFRKAYGLTPREFRSRS